MTGPVSQTITKKNDSVSVRGTRSERPFDTPYNDILALQRAAGNRAVSDQVRAVQVAPGRPLDSDTRSFMESRFGASFADVRVHTGAAASHAAAGVHARAYTVGQDVVFANGRYAPQTANGRHLLAHELAHVVQQRHARPAVAPAVAPAHSPPESAATAAAAQVVAGETAGPVGGTAVTTIQRAPENDPATLDPLGPVADFLVDVAAGSGPAKELFAAAMRGFIAEMRTQLVTRKRGEAALNRLQELKSIKNAGVLYAGYVGGFLAGAISPLTGLFDLAVFGEKLQQMQMQLLSNVLKGGGALVDEARALVGEFVGFGKKAVGKLKELKDKPLETINALFKDLSAAAIKKANEAGHGAAKSVIKSFESNFEEKPSESWGDILTRRKEGESYTQPLGLVSSLIERSKEKVLSTPWARIGYDIGYAVGAVAVNVVLLATTGGVGNAIADIGAALGRIAPVLGRAAEAVVAIGKAIAAVEEGIAFIVQGALKPLQPLFRELEPLFLRLRGFLRRLLGLAEDEAGTLAGAAGKTAAAELKVIEGGGQKVSPPQGKLKLASSEGADLPEWFEPTAHPSAGQVKSRRPSGFQPTSHKPGRRVKAGTLTDLEPTAVKSTGRPAGRKITTEEQLYGIPSEQQWLRIRGKTPTAEIQQLAQKELPIGSPDPAFPGLQVTAPAQADHIVPVDQIRKMPGFAALDESQQLQVLNMKENFVALSPTANQSKGARSFSEWTRHEGLDLPVDPGFRQTMIQREQELIPRIQERINEFLRAK